MIGMPRTAEWNPDADPAGERSTRDRILKEAAVLFGAQGYAPTTMRTIAAACGLTPGALYWHFPSKDAILHDILAEQSAAYDRTLEPVRAATSSVDKLKLYVRAVISWQVGRMDPAHRIATIPFAVNHLLQSLPDGPRMHILGLVQAHVDMLADIVTRGMEDGSFARAEVSVTTYAVLNMCEYVVTWWTPDHPLDPQELEDAYEQLVLRMVGADTQPGRSAP